MPNKALHCTCSAFPLPTSQGLRLIRTRRPKSLTSKPANSNKITRSAVVISVASLNSSTGPILLPNSTEDAVSNDSIDNKVLSDVEICHVETLPTENSLQDALMALETAISDTYPVQFSNLQSGLLRLEVPLPRSINALHWLRGQNEAVDRSNDPETGVDGSSKKEGESGNHIEAASSSSLFPKILFSPRRSSAPDTEGSIAAGAASAGAGSVAGAGAAWLWKGQPGQPLDASAMSCIQRFLKTDHPRVRVFGGSRFDPGSNPAPEWEEFGSYCFVLPRVELLELSGCSMLACTLAWEAATTNNNNNINGSGYTSFTAAAAAAISALNSIKPASPPHAPAFRLIQHSMQHLPSEDEWATRLDAVHAELVPATPSSPTVTDVTFGTTTTDMTGTEMDEYDGNSTGSTNNSTNGTGGSNTIHPLQKLSPDVALEEYLRNGQQGLDELLAALDSGFEAILSTSGSAEDDSSGSDGDLVQNDKLNATNSRQDNGNGNGNGRNNGATGSSTSKKASKKASNDKNNSKNGRNKSKNRQGMSKIVLARRTDLCLEGRLDPLTLLEALQDRDPRAYQIFLQLSSGSTFLASTPECLYTRSGSDVASEAVAGTRARGSGGDVEKDFWLAFDLLRSQKDDVEFGVVRDWVRRALGTVCDDVRVEITKSVLKQGSVQHLYGKLAGKLRPEIGDAALLAALHPTPAVCGQPRGDALKMLSKVETFDRGFYSGPFGWVSRDAAEFVVAIRSALVRPGQTFLPSSTSSSTLATSSTEKSISAYDVALYAGVGIVCGSDTASEWAELNLKISQFERLLKPAPAFSSAPNLSSLWARVMVEELCRLGCNTFCVAPGSRSSPLTAAIAAHPRARIVPCIDERSLGFWALGYGRARGLPAVVVTSSGTAVANLLPAVVEASQSNVPMLLLTADRPFELRDTGANQTINQVNIFGSYTRWDCDLEAPLESTSGTTAVEKVGEAVRAACATYALPAGPVHLNCQFREPLAPAEEKFDNFACLEGLKDWETSQKAFKPLSKVPTMDIADNGHHPLPSENNHELDALLSIARKARRGLLIIGELIQPQDVAATVQLAQTLGWPIAADALSGIKVGARPPPGAALNLISHFDHLLLDSTHWNTLKPDVVLQIGGHLTSKRVAQFLEYCCSDSATSQPRTSWMFVSRAPLRQDQGSNVSIRVKSTVPELLTAFQQHEDSTISSAEQEAYCQLLQNLDSRASIAIDAALSEFYELTEPAVARVLSQELPPGEGLFIGNSMPIRDLDMYGMPAVRAMHAGIDTIHSQSPNTSIIANNGNFPTKWTPSGIVEAGVGAPVAANRGASGIDGVLSTAAGFADGLQRGTTLVVGDISFLHDVNGLNLLRSGDMRPPLTVVLVNNGGGGIFSFLPIADHLPDEVFTPLWATPQNVDLAGMCRAHGIPHIKVSSPEELRTALRSAWGLNRHSVIEAITDREANVIRHREIQTAVKDALSATFASSSSSWASSEISATAGNGSITSAYCSPFELPLRNPVTTTSATAGSSANVRRGIFFILNVKSSSNMNNTNTSSSTAIPTSREIAGEVSPLPGLHKENLEQAYSQTQFICELLSSAAAAAPPSDDNDPSISVLSLPDTANDFEPWLKRTLAIDAKDLFPSVRFGLEGAVFSAMAEARGCSLAELFSKDCAQPTPSSSFFSSSSIKPSSVQVNAMIDPQGKSDLAREMAESLLQKQNGLLNQCIKIKVGRTANVLDDVAAVCAVYNVFSGQVKLRLDANRTWTLEQAVQFGQALNASIFLKSEADLTTNSVAVSQAVDYIEEPLQNPTVEKLSEFYRKAKINIALDESVDQGLFGLAEIFDKEEPVASSFSDTFVETADISGNGSDGNGTNTLEKYSKNNSKNTTAAASICLPEGVTTLVLKPSVLGGFLPTLKLVDHARTISINNIYPVAGGRKHIECVVSSAFESPLGICHLAHLAAAIDSLPYLSSNGKDDSVLGQYHGLGTGEWWNFENQPVDVAAKATEVLTFTQNQGSGQQIFLEKLGELTPTERPAVLELTNTLSTSNGVIEMGRNSRIKPEIVTVEVATDVADYSFKFLETRSSMKTVPTTTNASSTTPQLKTIVFLHGFLGQPEEWLPFMKSFSSTTTAAGKSYRCLSVCLPGHGSTVSPKQSIASSSDAYSLESTAAALEIALEKLGVSDCVIVGYSLGARLALLLSTQSNSSNTSSLKISKVISISGTPGIPVDDIETRKQRAEEDAIRAGTLRKDGLDAFMSSWYAAPMWDTLTTEQNRHIFNRILQNRKRGLQGLELSLSLTLENMSPGRAPDVRSDLYCLSSQGKLPKMVFIAGEHDSKFVGIAKQVVQELNSKHATAVIVNKSGHAVHIEQPVVLHQILFDLITSS